MAGLQTRGSRYSGKADRTSGERESDKRERRARDRESSAPFEAAYNAGLRGDDPAEFQTDDRLAGAYEDGAKAAKGQARQDRTDKVRGDVGAKAGSMANDGAGFVLGLIGYAILVNYLRAGVPGVRAWTAAKFLNRTSGAGKAVAATPSQPSAPAAAQIRGVGA